MVSVLAVPAYTKEMVTSRIASLMPLAEGLKVDIVEQHSYGVVFGNTTEVQIAAAAPDKPKYLESLVRDVYGCITINYDTAELGLDTAEDLALVYCPTNDVDGGVISWGCGYSAGSEATYSIYLPTNCRQVITTDTTF
jgi:hypothetical protein